MSQSIALTAISERLRNMARRPTRLPQFRTPDMLIGQGMIVLSSFNPHFRSSRRVAHRRARTLALLLLAASLAALVASPVRAEAVETIGSDLTAADGAGSNPGTSTVALIPGRPTIAPIDGVIHVWRAKGGANPGTLNLRVLRPAGGGEFTGIATGPTEAIAGEFAGTTMTFTIEPLGVPVQAGDVIGLDSTVSGMFASTLGARTDNWLSGLADGATDSPVAQFGFELLLNADIEPDVDGDLLGDETHDSDLDNDGADDGTDNCLGLANPSQANNDGDAQGDACDPDDDNDSVLDAADNCTNDANVSQLDSDGDGAGDACDTTAHGTDVNLELTGAKKVKAGKPVKVKVTCPTEECDVSARATFKVPAAAVSISAKTTSLKTKKLASSLAGGVTQTLKLKLKPKDKKTLIAAAKKKANRKQTKIIVKATATDLGGNKETEKSKLKLK